MDEPPTKEAAQQLEKLTAAVEELCRRVSALEQRAGVVPAMEFSAPAAVHAHAPDLSSGLLAALGRALLGIAGAYLLRALTEAAILPQLAGAILGLAYAGAWLAFSFRMTSANRMVIALQGLTASSIATALLWEATVRFHSFSPAGAAAALALFVILGQALAWRHELSAIAGVTALAGTAMSVALISATLDPVPFSIAVLAAAASVELGACLDHALALRWIIALAVDFCAFFLTFIATRPGGLPEGYAAVPVRAVIGVQIAAVAIYAGSLLARTLIRKRPVRWFEIVQTALIVGLAIGSALRISQAAAVIGAACLVASIACYAAAFVGSSARPVRNFHLYATYGLLLAMAGGFLWFSNSALILVWAIGGLAALALGGRVHGPTLHLHGAAYVAAGAAASGLLAYCFERMLVVARRDGTPLNGVALLCALAIVCSYALVLWLRRHRTAAWNQRLGSAILVALLCWTTVGLAGGWLIGSRLEASLVSTVRTALIVVVAIALAWFGRRANVDELIWVLYPWMTLGAVKLFVEDFQQGRPLTLFLSLFLYGGTLIALPRLLRRAGSGQPDLS